MKFNIVFLLLLPTMLSVSCGDDAEQPPFPGTVSVVSIRAAGQDLMLPAPARDVAVTATLIIEFSSPLNPSTIEQGIRLLDAGGQRVPATTEEAGATTLHLIPTEPLDDWGRYTLMITQVSGSAGEVIAPVSQTFYAGINDQPDFPVIADDELLNLVQAQTFRYFWDFGHPFSGMARERDTSGDLVTTGGTGFGLMALIVGIERGFITRIEGTERLDRILDFLERAPRYHGAWSHWMNGQTAATIPFSPQDDGGDLVETSFLIMGLLTVRQYLNAADPAEQSLIDRINALWRSVEWRWYTRGNGDVLYWHWSPEFEWGMDLPVRGYNEALITYVLAASSPDHPIDEDVYSKGWAADGALSNNKRFYDYSLPLGPDFGGPLFFAHYSFLGLDPRNLRDRYADYWTQNVNHTSINRAYCLDNPRGYVGYTAGSWGLTASDSPAGYDSHHPLNDEGVITPSAAISSMPYAPGESMDALRFMYYHLGDRLWGPYGFHDAYDITEGWFADSYLAIDQGPIIIMIENHRTGKLWDLFMSCPEVQQGLGVLGFTY